MNKQNLYGSQVDPQEARDTTATSNSTGRDVLDDAGVNVAMSGQLSIRADKRPWIPLHLDVLPKGVQPGTLAQHMRYLAARMPIAGHEPLISVNQKAVLERASSSLIDRLSAPETKLPFSEITRQTCDAALELRRQFDVQLQQAREAYDKADKILRRFQDEALKATVNSGGFFNILTRLLNSTITMAEAVNAFNERELSCLQRDQLQASQEVIAKIIAMCERLQNALESTRAAALNGEQEALQEAVTILHESLEQGRIADYQVNPDRVLDGAGGDETITAYLPELIVEARDNGGSNVVKVARDIATRIVARLYGALGLIELLQREAANTRVDGKAIDPTQGPLLVGEDVLDIVRRARPSLYLTDDAHPRDFVLQIGNDARPLFAHPSLIAARFHHPRSEFAFMRVQTEVALDELQVMREGESDFNEALKRREFFINEEVIQAWRERGGVAQTVAPDPGPTPAPSTLSGMMELTAEQVRKPSPNGNEANPV